jgi:hypothetical protein
MARRNYPFAKAEANIPKQHGGNAYYAIQTTEAFYADFVMDYGQTYTDHTYSIHNTIQSAIDAVTANRGDIVYVVGEWTVTATESTKINLNEWGTTLKGLTDWENMTGGGNANITCAEEAVATVTVSKAKCHIENLVIYFNGAGEAMGIEFKTNAPSQTVIRNVEVVKNGGSNTRERASTSPPFLLVQCSRTSRLRVRQPQTQWLMASRAAGTRTYSRMFRYRTQ